MSNRIVYCVLICALAGAGAGCQTDPAEWRGYAEMTPQELLSPGNDFWFPGAAGPTEAQRAAPRLRLRATLLGAPPKDLAQRGSAVQGPVTIIAPEQAEMLRMDYGTCGRLTSLPLIIFSGERMSITSIVDEKFIHDVVYKEGPAGVGGRFEKVTDRVPMNFMVVGAKADGDDAVISHLEAGTTTLLGLRMCEGKAPLGDKLVNIAWQEAILAEGVSQVKNPCEIRLWPGAVAVVRLKYRVRQTAGNARLYVREWTSRKEGPTDLGRKAFAEREMLLLIEAEVLPPLNEVEAER